MARPSDKVNHSCENALQENMGVFVSHTDYQQHHGNSGLMVSPCRIFIYTKFFSWSSPDGCVYDPNELEQPYGYLEVQCLYSVRDCTPEEARLALHFYCNLDSTRKLKLKETHQYLPQVQGQMAIGKRMWCDFMVHT